MSSRQLQVSTVAPFLYAPAGQHTDTDAAASVSMGDVERIAYQGPQAPSEGQCKALDTYASAGRGRDAGQGPGISTRRAMCYLPSRPWEPAAGSRRQGSRRRGSRPAGEDTVHVSTQSRRKYVRNHLVDRKTSC